MGTAFSHFESGDGQKTWRWPKNIPEEWEVKLRTTFWLTNPTATASSNHITQSLS